MYANNEEFIKINVEYTTDCINNVKKEIPINITSITNVEPCYYYSYITKLLHVPIYITQEYDVFINKKNNYTTQKTSLISCGLDYKMLFFDVFKKNNKLFMIIPVYNHNISFINKIKIVNNGVELELKDTYTKIKQEPIIILIYHFISNNNTITIKYNDNVVKHCELENVKTKTSYNLTLTTLFKDDYYLFDAFYNYYTKQGVEHFYMYYNGKINNKIRNIFNKSNVTLIEWDFVYWNDNTCSFKHHAQIGQMHHAIYKYGKGTSKYMIFCDLDEYMSSASNKIIDLISSNHHTYRFSNVFSEISYKNKNLNQKQILHSQPYPFSDRSKCIHKLDAIKTINIHCIDKYMVASPKIQNSINNYMYHFYKIGSKSRKVMPQPWHSSVKNTLPWKCNIKYLIQSKENLLYDLIDDLIKVNSYNNK